MASVVNCRGTEEQRFWRKVRIAENGCWEWIAGKMKTGYGGFGLETLTPYEHRVVTAHSWVYKRYIGPMPPGTELDHLCRNRACVNPLHLEAVTHRVNALRGVSPSALAARQTHCIYGHPLSPENTYINPRTHGRYCRTCKARRDREYYLRRKEKETYGNKRSS